MNTLQKTLPLICLLLMLLVTAACTSNSTSNATDQQELADARATAQAAIAERDNAIQQAQQLEAQLQTTTSDAEPRLEIIKERGYIVCAGRNELPGFGYIDENGTWKGFDADLCRAVATAVFGDPNAFQTDFITASERGPTIQSGDVDILARNSTWTTYRDANWGNYTVITFYDGQGFMAPEELGINSIYELDGAAICVNAGTTTELNLADFFRQNNFEYNPKVFQQWEVMVEAYLAGQCDAMTSNISLLASTRSVFPNPENHPFLPERISEEPSTPIVPHGDEHWFDIVKTVLAGLIYAEAYGINSNNVDTVAQSNDVKAKRLFGIEGGFGQETLGLKDTFMQDVIKQVGNYGEIYERNIGTNGIGLPRKGRNDLWLNGGQIYAPPLR